MNFRGSFPIHKFILQISLYSEDIFDCQIVPKLADVDVSPIICNMFLEAFWNFSEHSSVLVAAGFPYFQDKEVEVDVRRMALTKPTSSQSSVDAIATQYYGSIIGLQDC